MHIDFRVKPENDISSRTKTYQAGNGAKTVGSPDNDTKDTCGTSPIWNSARQKQDEMVMPDNDIEFRRTMTQMSFPCRDTGISGGGAVTAAGKFRFCAEMQDCV